MTMKTDWTPQELEEQFRFIFEDAIKLMLRKNHDYGNSWAEDRPSTITDTIRHKIDRVRNLEELGNCQNFEEVQQVPDKVSDELLDIINYACFRRMMEDFQ